MPNAFESQYRGHSSRQNSDETGRRPLNSIIFGNSDSGYPLQTNRANSNTNMGYSGYNSSVASRSGSMPPSRNGIDHQPHMGDYSANLQPSQIGPAESLVHRPMQAPRTSDYSVNGAHRFQNQASSLQFGDLSNSLGKLEIRKEIPEPSYSSYLEPSQRAGSGSNDAIPTMNNNAYRANQTSHEPEPGLGTSYSQYRVQFGDRNAHSPSGMEYRRSHESPLYSTTVTPPMGDHQRAPSSTSLRSNTSNRQAALLEQKLRGLQQEQQNYMAPQLNLQFRPPYLQQYDYGTQAMLRMNPLAQFYPPQPLRYPTTQIMPPRGAIVDAAAGESLRSSLLEEFRSNNKGTKRYELKVWNTFSEI